MHLTLPLLAALTFPGLPNLDLATGKRTHWEGQGGKFINLGGRMAITTAGGPTDRTLIHRTFTVPEGAQAIEFAAALYRPNGINPGEMLDVVLEAARRKEVPRQIRRGDAWVAAPQLLGPRGKQLQSYRWVLDGFVGKQVRIAIVDHDDRDGCYLVTTGFRLVTRDEINARTFAEQMQVIQDKHKLPRAQRYDTRHFVAMSTADAGYSDYRLYNCETIYDLFFPHFRKRGFEIRPPVEKMMVAIFDRQEGLESYLGQKISTSVTGLYHPASNRLLIYDYGTNRAFAAGAARAQGNARQAASDLDRERRMLSVNRAVRDLRNDTNISTVMHEVAHQLSFNCGMLNRQGDVPVWLAEGLAVYCESTIHGTWQGIGEANPARAKTLSPSARGETAFIPMRDLIRNDDWIRKATRVEQVVLGYSQSWALYRMLIDERPKQLKAYHALIHDRRTPDHRLSDFATAFGSDLTKLEARYQQYMRDLVRREVR